MYDTCDFEFTLIVMQGHYGTTDSLQAKLIQCHYHLGHLSSGNLGYLVKSMQISFQLCKACVPIWCPISNMSKCKQAHFCDVYID